MSDEALEARVASLEFNNVQQATRIRTLEKQVDTHGSRCWKTLLFRLDGWGPWWVIRDKPAWRPWHRWWVS